MERCGWAGSEPIYAAYHDEEWGVPEYDSRALWEKLVLDGFQAGLSWITILKKRDNFRAAFAGFGGQARALLAQVDEVRLWGLFRHPVAAKWYGPGVAILGDAAHPTLPFMAQGANMALEDAWVLADCLDRLGAGEAGLTAYQAARRDRVSRVIAAANGNAWKYHLSARPVRGLAHLGLRLGGALMPGRMLHQFDWIYGHDVTA